MRIIVSGSSGLIGSALIPVLRQGGHDVGRLVRPGRLPPPGDVAWSPLPGDRGTIDQSALEGVEAVVHLAGESIFGRWTSRKKRRIAESRVAGTTLLARALAGLERKPRVLVSASGAHFYGDRGVETLTEESAPGRGFLAETCQAWEAATRPAADAGIRVVLLRSGVVLSPAGGVLRVLLLPFRLGLGGPIGRGRAYWSWIGLPDLVRAIRFALERDELAGPINTTTPNPVTNAEFTRTLARVLRRPAWFPVPPAGLRLVFGREAANELMLSSTRLLPQRLQASGFRFDHPELEPALRAVLG